MRQNILKTLIFWLLVLLLGPFAACSAKAQHLKAIGLGTVLNPLDWEELYDPGMVVSKAFNQWGRISPNFIWKITAPPKKSTGEEDEDLLLIDEKEDNAGSPKKEMKLPVQFVLEAELLIFDPHVDIPESLSGVELEETEYAETHIHLKIIDYFTQRVVSEEKLWAIGSGGTQPFPNTPDSLLPGHPDFQKTSMGRAIENLSIKTFQYLSRVLNEIPLDSQILFVDNDQNMVTLNAGQKQGVKIGEEFTIYNLTRNLEDPITGADLGDLFRRLGVVRIIKVGEGFSEAIILIGDNFKRGMIARGEKQNIELLLVSEKGGSIGSEKNIDDKPFEGFKREKEYPRSTITSFDFFSIMGFELGY